MLLVAARKPIAWRPSNCRGLCSDEAPALGTIGTAQHAQFAAALLLDADERGDALQATQALCGALARHGLMVGASTQAEPCGFDVCPHRKLN